MKSLSKPWNKQRLKRLTAIALAVAVVCGLLYHYTTCDEWLSEMPDGRPGTNQTCKCHGWQAMLYDQISMDGSRKYICAGSTYTEPGVVVEDSEPPPDGAADMPAEAPDDSEQTPAAPPTDKAPDKAP